MTMKITNLSPQQLPLAQHPGLADLQVRSGQHDLPPRSSSDAALDSAADHEVASLVVALAALVGITLAVLLLGAPAPTAGPARLDPAAGLQIPAATVVAPHPPARPVRLMHGR